MGAWGYAGQSGWEHRWAPGNVLVGVTVGADVDCGVAEWGVDADCRVSECWRRCGLLNGWVFCQLKRVLRALYPLLGSPCGHPEWCDARHTYNVVS